MDKNPGSVVDLRPNTGAPGLEKTPILRFANPIFRTVCKEFLRLFPSELFESEPQFNSNGIFATVGAAVCTLII